MADPEKMTIIVFSGELDKALAAFNLAIGGASMGMEVTMFFTFWGLNVIRKEADTGKTKGLMKSMLKMMNKGGAGNLPLSRFDMAGIGRSMMKSLMKQGGFPPLDEMIKTAKELGVKFIACTTSCSMMGVSQESVIPGVDTFAGVATYLATARESKVNLFI